MWELILNLGNGQNNEERVPSINEIQVLMVENENKDGFKQLFIIFAYAIILVPMT